MKRKKLLVVGSIPDESNLLNYGGATVLMKNYLDYLASQSEYEYRFVQNNRYSNLRTRQRSMWRNYS
ncbi:glycosyl transferase family 1, partial [Phocaeicola vulgatus]|nr:glycosyl transferase family 1 [Phocaeicola vulgatus]